MIRLDERDFHDPQRLARLAETVRMTPDQFQQRFAYLVPGT
jgi:6-phosphofructokinase 1